MSSPTKAAARQPLAAAVVGTAFVYALWFHDKGLVTGEEGQILTEAEAILRGQVLYRDIDGYVAPGVWYLTALVLAIAGHTVNAMRVAMAALFALQVGLVFATTDRVATRRAALAGVGVLLLAKVLAFPLGVFVFYTEFAVFLGLLALHGLVAFEQQADPGAAAGRRWLLLSGVAAALAAVFKQTIGAYVLLGFAGYLLVVHRSVPVLLRFAAPSALVGGLTLAGFAAAGALPDLVHALVVKPFTEFYDVGKLSYFTVFAPRSLEPEEAYLYWPVLFWEERFLGRGWGTAWLPVARGVGVLAFATPVAITGWALLRAGRTRRLARLDGLLLLGALLLFAGVFPRADFAHVAQVLVGFVPLGARLVETSRWRASLWWAAAPVAAVVTAFCAVLLWNFPYTQRLEHPRARVWLSRPAYAGLTETLGFLEEALPPDEGIAILPASAMYYFLTGRPVPYRYTVAMPPNVGFDGGRDAARLLEERDIRYVVYSRVEVPSLPPFEEWAPELHAAIATRYEPVSSRRFRRVETLQILKRRDDR